MAKVIIEESPYSYVVFRYDDGMLEIMVCMPSVGPGVEVLHTLSAEEEAAYQTTGIVGLQARMVDMKENYGNYKVVPWR